MVVDPNQMPQKISGGLLPILKVSRVAWYRGAGGITAYYEQPAPGVPGAVFVNGRRVTSLHVDREGLYADFPSPTVQHILIERGVDLAKGWTCGQEKYGTTLEDAVKESPHGAARHHIGRISLQHIDDVDEVVIFVYGRRRWKVESGYVGRAIEEMGLDISTGWYAIQVDLIAMHATEERGEQ